MICEQLMQPLVIYMGVNHLHNYLGFKTIASQTTRYINMGCFGRMPHEKHINKTSKILTCQSHRESVVNQIRDCNSLNSYEIYSVFT